MNSSVPSTGKENTTPVGLTHLVATGRSVVRLKGTVLTDATKTEFEQMAKDTQPSSMPASRRKKSKPSKKSSTGTKESE